METRGTLKEGEPHPEAFRAAQYLLSIGQLNLVKYSEAFASCSIEGNRWAEICSETLDRFLKGNPVSDRYILGLAWAIRRMEDEEKKSK